MKTIFRIFSGLVIVSILAVGIILGPYVLRLQHIPASPSDGYHADFYLYISPGARRAANDGRLVTILVQPNNSGISSDDPAVHRRDAWWTGFERYRIANELDVILLIPAFIRPGEDWYIYTHALDRDSLMTERADLKRIDLQLIAMIDHARLRLAEDDIVTEEQVLIQGFSASGMFADRFTVLHPERVKAAAIGSPGGWPIAPLALFNGQVLNYPAGIADLDALTGAAFDSVAYNAVPQLIYMGSLDDNDSLDFTDGWNEADAAAVNDLFGADPLSRWEDARAVHLDAGANVEFLLIDGVGHNRSNLQKYATEFFKKVLSAQ
jgi:hypothetical protein